MAVSAIQFMIILLITTAKETLDMALGFRHTAGLAQACLGYMQLESPPANIEVVLLGRAMML